MLSPRKNPYEFYGVEERVYLSHGASFFYVHVPFAVYLLEYAVTQLSSLTIVELWCYFFTVLNLHASICLPSLRVCKVGCGCC